MRLEHTCGQCAAPFHAKRTDAQFCSATCRKRASRGVALSNENETLADFRRWLVGRSFAGRISQDAPIYGLTVPRTFAGGEWNGEHPDAAMTEAQFRARFKETGWLDYGESRRISR